MNHKQRAYKDRITADPKILGGKPVIRGTRIAVSQVLDRTSDLPTL